MTLISAHSTILISLVAVAALPAQAGQPPDVVTSDSSFNTAMGTGAMGSLSGGADNTAAGYSALPAVSGSDNSAFGFEALFSTTIGVNNTAFGGYALYSNTTGKGNQAQGVNALFSNTTGIRNLGIGSNALYSNQTGSYNVALGFDAGYNSTGNDNIYINNAGVSGESQTLRLGAEGSPGVEGSGITSAYVAGVVNTPVSGGRQVLITPTGQLGVAVSEIVNGPVGGIVVSSGDLTIGALAPLAQNSSAFGLNFATSPASLGNGFALMALSPSGFFVALAPTGTLAPTGYSTPSNEGGTGVYYSGTQCSGTAYFGIGTLNGTFTDADAALYVYLMQQGVVFGAVAGGDSPVNYVQGTPALVSAQSYYSSQCTSFGGTNTRTVFGLQILPNSPSITGIPGTLSGPLKLSLH